MPRPLRPDVAGGVHHVYARGNDRQVIFRDDIDRRIYLATLKREIQRTDWRCLSYSLMENHVHLLLETPKPNLSTGMQRLHGRYAQVHNARHGRVGHLFQGRFGSTQVLTDEQLWTTALYIARNPVVAGLCAAPDEWPWSSYAATVGSNRPSWLDAPRLLSYFGAAGGDGRKRYIAAVAAGQISVPATQGVRPPES